MSEGTLEVVADQLRRVENLGPLSRLVFAITNYASDESDPYAADVICVVVPTESLKAIMSKIQRAAPPRMATADTQWKLVEGGRDVATAGKC